MMMGHPRSLDPRVEIISGVTSVEVGDNSPTRNIWRMRTRKFKEDAIFRGNAGIPPCMYADAIPLRIPEQREFEPRHDGINYTDDIDRPLAMNEFEVPDEELVHYNELVAKNLPGFKEFLYEGVSVLNAVGDSLDYTEAALRDGLGIEVDMDRAILDAYIPLTRLDMVARIVEKTHLSASQRQMFMMKITELFAEKTVAAFDKHDVEKRARKAHELTMELQQHAQHARVSAKEKLQMPQASPSRYGVTGKRR